MRSIKSLRRSVYWLSVLAILLQAGLPLARAYADTGERTDPSSFPFGLSEICSALTTASGVANGAPGSGAPVSKSGHCVLCHLPAFGGAALDARVVLPEPVSISTVIYVPDEIPAVQQSAAVAPKPIRAPPV